MRATVLQVQNKKIAVRQPLTTQKLHQHSDGANTDSRAYCEVEEKKSKKILLKYLKTNVNKIICYYP
jgi:hypothetical protein